MAVMPGIHKCWSSTCSNSKRVSPNPNISHAPCSRVSLNGNRMQVGAQRWSGVLAHSRRCTENTSTQGCSRKGFLAGTVSIVAVARELVHPDGAKALACQGLRAYELQQCLKEKRAAQEEEVRANCCPEHAVQRLLFCPDVLKLKWFLEPQTCCESQASSLIHLVDKPCTSTDKRI